ncbi:MAG: hypothetical protein PHX83_04135 [Acidobacteriia bacterium]|nr:hypothetical protein [Terriglobia bacterium]
MSWFKDLLKGNGGNSAAGVEPTPTSASVEQIVAELRKNKPRSPLCHLVLFGDRPLTGKMGSDESIMIFSSADKAARFIEGYQRYYRTTKPLSVLALPSISDLWAMLNNASSDPLYQAPYGLIINFSYSGGTYNSYSIGQLKTIGPSGLKKGMSMLS